MERADASFKVAITALKTQGEVSSKYNKHFNRDEFKNEKTKNKSQKSYFQQTNFRIIKIFKVWSKVLSINMLPLNQNI